MEIRERERRHVAGRDVEDDPRAVRVALGLVEAQAAVSAERVRRQSGRRHDERRVLAAAQVEPAVVAAAPLVHRAEVGHVRHVHDQRGVHGVLDRLLGLPERAIDGGPAVRAFERHELADVVVRAGVEPAVRVAVRHVDPRADVPGPIPAGVAGERDPRRLVVQIVAAEAQREMQRLHRPRGDGQHDRVRVDLAVQRLHRQRRRLGRQHRRDDGGVGHDTERTDRSATGGPGSRPP